MNRRELLLAGGAVLALARMARLSYSADAPRKKLLFFTKSAGFEHDSIRRVDGKLSHAETVLVDLGRAHAIDVLATKDGRVFDDDLEQYDGFFFYTTGDLTQEGNDKQPPMTSSGKERLLKAIHGGKGFLASHCGSDTFHSQGNPRETQTELDPYVAMLGGEFISHGPQQVARQTVTASDFPGLEGVPSTFEMNEEWYSLKNFSDDLHVILAMDTQGMDGVDYQRPPFPATWARRHGEGRVFYTSMGHREDVWTNETFQQVLLAGVNWALRRTEAPNKPNMLSVTPGARVMPPAE